MVFRSREWFQTEVTKSSIQNFVTLFKSNRVAAHRSQDSFVAFTLPKHWSLRGPPSMTLLLGSTTSVGLTMDTIGTKSQGQHRLVCTTGHVLSRMRETPGLTDARLNCVVHPVWDPVCGQESRIGAPLNRRCCRISNRVAGRGHSWTLVSFITLPKHWSPKHWSLRESPSMTLLSGSMTSVGLPMDSFFDRSQTEVALRSGQWIDSLCPTAGRRILPICLS